MAKYSILRTCGHIETANICGPTKDRPRQEQYEATKSCYDCYKAEQARKRTEQSAEAATAAEAAGLPALNGSDKQVAWAETIRQECFRAAQNILAKLPTTVAQNPEQAKTLEICKGIVGQTNAGWWIDHRGLSFQTLVKQDLAA